MILSQQVSYNILNIPDQPSSEIGRCLKYLDQVTTLVSKNGVEENLFEELISVGRTSLSQRV